MSGRRIVPLLNPQHFLQSQKRHPPGIQEFNPYRSVPPPPPRLSTTLDMHFDQLSLSSDQIPDMRYLVGRISRGRTIPHPRAKSPYEEELASRFSSPVPHPPSTPRPHTAASVRGRRSVISSRPNVSWTLIESILWRNKESLYRHVYIYHYIIDCPIWNENGT